jgi:hypothetical protein
MTDIVRSHRNNPLSEGFMDSNVHRMAAIPSPLCAKTHSEVGDRMALRLGLKEKNQRIIQPSFIDG